MRIAGRAKVLMRYGTEWDRGIGVRDVDVGILGIWMRWFWEVKGSVEEKYGERGVYGEV